MTHAAPEAAEHAASLADVLQQLELRSVESLMDVVARYRCVGPLRLTCRALRDVADASVRVSKMLSLQLREDGTATEPLASLGRWGRRGGLGLEQQLPAEAPGGGVDALLPAAFTQLPEEARRRVTRIRVSVEEPRSETESSDFQIKCFKASDFETSDSEAAEGSESEAGDSNRSDDDAPTISGAAVGALAAWLPCLRRLDLSDLPSTWSFGGAGEAYAALAALGTLEELELPGVPGLTGVEALAGSLRRLTLVERRSPRHTLTRSAAASLGQLTRLKALNLAMSDMDLGEGPTLGNLLRLLPPSTEALRLTQCLVDAEHGLYGTFGVSRGRLVSARLQWPRLQELAAVARDELLPCLGPDGRLESFSIDTLYADSWNTSDLGPLLELWRRSDQARVDELAVEQDQSSADVCSALMVLGPVKTFRLHCPVVSIPVNIRRPQQSQIPPPIPPPSLPPPEEVLRMALQRIAPPGAGGEGGACALLLRGPTAAAALEQPSSEDVKAWAQDLERRAIAAAGDATEDGRFIKCIHVLPPASTVLLTCGEPEGAAEAVAAAVEAAGDGSEAARVRTPGHLSLMWFTALEWGLGEVMTELWAASCADEGGPNLQQRVEWAVAMLGLVKGLPEAVFPWGRLP